jgi:dTDP-glucose pyrophosphorylase
VKTLLLSAGGSQAYADAGYFFPKNLTEIAGKPMIEHSITSLGSLAADEQLVVAIAEEEDMRYHTGRVIRLIEPTATVVTVGETSGAACTALLAIDHLPEDEPLLVVNGDAVFTTDLAAIVASFERRGLDGGVVVFEAVHPRWSYVRVDPDGFVIEASEKRPISRHATAGVYWFARGRDFVEAAMGMIRKDASIDGKFFVCPVYNEMILDNQRIGIHEIGRDAYHSLHDPQGIPRYEATLSHV